MKSMNTIFVMALLALQAQAFVSFDPDHNTPTSGVVTLSVNELDYQDRVINTLTSFPVTLYNGTSDTLTLENAWFAVGDFEMPLPQPWPLIIPPADSAGVSIVFSPQTNIAYEDQLFLELDQVDQAIPVALHGRGFLLPFDYTGTYNLFDEELEAAIADLFPNQVTLGYNAARAAMYGNLDNFNDSLECVYTGFRQYHESGSSSTFPNPINCEHSWPQSAFNEAEPMRSDVHHLFPTHEDANTARFYYPYGNVVSGVTWEWGGSRLGRNEYNHQVFEPRDIHKGDAARALFYFITRYGNSEYWMTHWQEDALREWFWEDPVSQKEIERNIGIAALQNTRNPFVDHPRFLDRILDLTGTANRPDSSVLVIAPAERTWEHDGETATEQMKVLLVNTGSMATEIQSASMVSGQSFSVLTEFPLVLEPDTPTPLILEVTYTPAAGQDTLLISSNASVNPTWSIPLTYTQAPVSISNESRIPQSALLLQAFPNPFNGATRIHVSSGAVPGKVSLYDLNGRKVEELDLPAETEKVTWSPAELPGGMYLVRAQRGTNVQTLKLLYLK